MCRGMKPTGVKRRRSAATIPAPAAAAKNTRSAAAGKAGSVSGSPGSPALRSSRVAGTAGFTAARCGVRMCQRGFSSVKPRCCVLVRRARGRRGSVGPRGRHDVALRGRAGTPAPFAGSRTGRKQGTAAPRQDERVTRAASELRKKPDSAGLRAGALSIPAPGCGESSGRRSDQTGKNF